MNLSTADIIAYANASPYRASILRQFQPKPQDALQGAPVKASRTRTMNGTERAFHDHLAALRASGEVAWFEFESLRLHLGGGAYFRPDFPTLMKDGTLQFFEVKGFMREAAKVRLRVAAGKFPWKFIVVKKIGGEFTYEEIKP